MLKLWEQLLTNTFIMNFKKEIIETRSFVPKVVVHRNRRVQTESHFDDVTEYYTGHHTNWSVI